MNISYIYMGETQSNSGRGLRSSAYIASSAKNNKFIEK